MPFTLAHPAAVLPLRRLSQGRLVWSALVIGTVAPDLEYFVRLTPKALVTATLPLGFAWDLAGGLALFLIFHGLVKKPAALLLPDRHRSALWPIAVRNVRCTVGHALAIGVSLLIGAGTHRIWDSFTHRDGWAVQQIPALRGLLVEVGGHQVATFKLLQHGSTLVGIVALGLVYVHWLMQQPSHHPVESPKLRQFAHLGAIVVVLAAAICFGLVNAYIASSNSPQDRVLVVRLGIGAIAGGVLAIVVIGLVFRTWGDRMITNQHR